MRAIAKRFCFVAILLVIPLFVSGCIVRPGWWWDDHHQPRRATIHVYVYDYYTYAPVSWAVVELYEEVWWGWDDVGAWQVNRAGHATVGGGYLHPDGGEEDFLIVVGASGYYTESIEIELGYWYPSETLYFYLLRWYGQDGRSADENDGEPPEFPVDRRPPDRVRLGEPKEGPFDPGN